ncbi:MAG: chorismate synthase [Nitrospinae bacterium]|nr:chorismate synthase [Nitrospinota bacterium]
MAGNSFGQQFRITTWGESHGPGVGVVIDGCPAGLPLGLEAVQTQLDRRKPGQSQLTSQRREADTAMILSGVFEGVTTGAPIAIMIENKNVRSTDYEAIKELFRPGHADYTWTKKYGLRDWRGGGRSSARETAARVAAGAVARELLRRFGVDVFAHTIRVGEIAAQSFNRAVIESNPVRCADPVAAARMAELIEAVRAEGDSVGGVIEVHALDAPAGLGEPSYDRLDADLAKALMSINAVKGVEIGDGFAAAARRGSENNDQMRMAEGAPSFLTNHSGGIDGGLSNGARIVARVAVKPTPSILKEQLTVDAKGRDATARVEGRHDPCIVPRAVPVVEAMVCLTLADHLLRDRAARL